MVINQTQGANYLIMAINGSLTAENREMLDQYLEAAHATGMHCILNLADVSFIDSATLGLMVLFYARYQDIGKKFIVVNINRQIYQMFSLTGLVNRLTIFNTLDEAIAALSGPGH